VRRVDAVWVIALVTDEQAGRNRAIGKFVGEAMRARPVAVSPIRNRAIAPIRMKAMPRPTVIRAMPFHTGPEALFEWGQSNSRRPSGGTVCGRLNLHRKLAPFGAAPGCINSSGASFVHCSTGGKLNG
jgi:hypothetical protein